MGISWKLRLSNEPFLEVFINVFTKCYKFDLRQIINGSTWKLCSFHNINGAIIWSMFVQGVHISLLRHIFKFLVLRRNFMWMWFSILWEKSINKKCISSFGNFHEEFCSNKLRFRAPRPSCTIKSFSLCFKFCMFMTRVSQSKALCCVMSKWRLFICQSTCRLTIQWWQDFCDACKH